MHCDAEVNHIAVQALKRLAVTQLYYKLSMRGGGGGLAL